MGVVTRPKLLLQLLPLRAWGVPLFGNPQVRSGAASGNRTPDLLITSELLWPTELRRRCQYRERQCSEARPRVAADPGTQRQREHSMATVMSR